MDAVTDEKLLIASGLGGDALRRLSLAGIIQPANTGETGRGKRRRWAAETVGRCWTADVATRTARGNMRQPDVTIDCAGVQPEALEATAPTVVFEVLSPSTRTFDQVRKVDEYKTVETMRAIVLIDPDRPRVLLWSRGGENDAWTDVELIGLEAALDLDAVKASLPLSDIYEDVAFEDA